MVSSKGLGCSLQRKARDVRRVCDHFYSVAQVLSVVSAIEKGVFDLVRGNMIRRLVVGYRSIAMFRCCARITEVAMVEVTKVEVAGIDGVEDRLSC